MVEYKQYGHYKATENIYGWHSYDDKPAIIYDNSYGTNNNSVWWYKNNKRHRLTGPAIIFSDGRECWFVNGNDVTEHMKNWSKERNIDLNNLSEEDSIVLKTELFILSQLT